jgi:hypothetical protein
MPDYEFRLYDTSNKLVLTYLTLCPDDEAAARELRKLAEISHARYDIWRGDELVLSGKKLGDGHDSGQSADAGH